MPLIVTNVPECQTTLCYTTCDLGGGMGMLKGVRKGGVGVKPPPLSLIFYENLLPAQRRLIVFAYFLLVNLSTYCKYHRINLHANFKEHCKRAKK